MIRPGVNRLLLTGLLLTALFSWRLYYGHDILLSGDEVGVGVVQAAGKWDLLRDSLQVNQVVPMEQLRSYVTYSPEYSGGDVLTIMWKDKLHPPLYFFMLHYILALFGNSAIALRAFSVLISVASVLAAYFIGKEFKDSRLGWIFAIFMVLSPYCLEYSVMVRLYPLAMLLGLLSTYFLLRIAVNKTISFSDPVNYGYILVSLAGMYTYYSFSVVLLSHFCFIVILSEKRLKNLLKIISLYLVILIFVIPWVFPFLDGMGQVNSKDLYFKGAYSLKEFGVYIFRTLFFPFNYPPVLEKYPFLEPIIMILTIIFSIIILTGIYLNKKNKLFMGLVISAAAYITVSFVNDKVFGTSTFMFDRQHYYTIPLLLLIVAGSVTGFTKRRFLFSSVLSLIVLVLLAGSAYRFNAKSMFDGPYFFGVLNQQLDQRCEKGNDRSCLILINMKEKRYVLPFVYSSKRNFDIILMPDGMNERLIGSILTTRKYQDVLAVNIDLSERKKKRLNLIAFEQEALLNTMNYSGYSLFDDPYRFLNEEQMTLYQFRRAR
jgi:uncharacterized membrane protein